MAGYEATAVGLPSPQAKRLELKECLINELQDKKRAYENYRHTSELGAGGRQLSVPADTLVSPLS